MTRRPVVPPNLQPPKGEWPDGSVRTPDAVCPFCDYKVDAATSIANPDARPEPGDVSLCLMCSQVVFFDSALSLRRPYVGELEAVMQDQAAASTIRRAQRAIRNIDRRKSAP